MKKTILRIVAVLIATIMIMANGITMSNAEAKPIESNNDTGTITVSKLEAGVTVYLYQLTTVNFDNTAKQPKDPVYAWADGIKEWLNTEENGYSIYADPEEFSKGVKDNSNEVAKFYSTLISAVRNKNIDLPVTKQEEVTGPAKYPVPEEKELVGQVSFENCAMGTYLILIENGYRVYTPSVVNLTPEFNDGEGVKRWELQNNVDVEIKSTTPTITKTVTSTDRKSDSYSTSDDIEFTIISDVPTFLESSLSKKYTITDKLSEGLKLDKDSIKVYGIKTDSTDIQLIEKDSYELKTEDATDADEGNMTFLIDFKYEKINTYKKVKITYNANLSQSESVVLGKNGNTNTAYLKYSNNPYVENSIQTQESSNIVYTYGIEVSKVDKSNNDLKLSGAKFSLSKEGGSNPMYFVKAEGGSDTVYYQAKNDEASATTELETDDAGLLKIYGLDEGTYTLTETKAPDGYNLAEKPVTIEIKDANDEEELDGKIKKNGEETGSEDESGIYKLTFPNTKGFQLPVTGGIGTILFVAGGIVLVGIGLSLLIVVIKRKKNN